MNGGLYIVITPFFPTDNSFRGSFVYDYVKAVERTGKFNRVIVFVPVPAGTDLSPYNYKGVEVYRFPYKFSPSYLFNGIFNGANKRLFIRRFKEIGLNPKDVRVAHAHVSYFGAMALALKDENKDIITMLHHHDLDPYTVRNGKFAGFLPNLWIRSKYNFDIFGKIDIHVCISNYVRNHLLDYPNDSPGLVFKSYRKKLKIARFLNLKRPEIKDSVVLYNGVDTSIFFPNRNKLDSKIFVIGCIANFIDLKDQMTLLKAVKFFRDSMAKTLEISIKVKLIGSGPELAACKDFVARNSLSDIVSFRNEVRHDALNDFYNSLDLFVLPSFFEGFGCVFTESAACGVPFIGCKGQGAMEYLTEECYDDFTITPGNYKELAHKIAKYMHGDSHQSYRYEYSIDTLVGDFIKKII